jgi:hypothetical protein
MAYKIKIEEIRERAEVTPGTGEIAARQALAHAQVLATLAVAERLQTLATRVNALVSATEKVAQKTGRR